MAPKKDKEEVLTRIAIVAEDRYNSNFCSPACQTLSIASMCLKSCWLPYRRCKPKKCQQECKKSCPVVKVGE